MSPEAAPRFRELWLVLYTNRFGPDKGERF